MSSPVCRVCIHETNDLVPLLNVYYENTPAMGFIKDIFQINICEGEDPNSLVICYTCNNALNSFYPFYMMVKQAQERLHNRRIQNQVNLQRTDPLNIEITNREPLSHSYSHYFDEYGDCSSIVGQNNNKKTIKEEVAIEYQGQGERECKYHMKDEQNLSKTSGKSDWMKEEGNMEYKQSQHDSDYMILESSQSSSQVHSNQSGHKSETKKKTVCVKRKVSTSNYNLGVKIKKSVFEDTERIVEARESLLRKYKVEDICQDGKWMLEEDDMDEVVSLFVDMKCRRCPAKDAFDNYKELNKHATKVHKKPLKLNCCDKEMERRFLEKHILYFHILKKYPPKKRKYINCPVCNKSILKQYQKNHLSVHLPPEMRQFQCHLCNFGCGSIGPLNAHMKNIHPSTKVQCDECDKSFKTLNVLQLHKKGVHSANPEHLCQECGKKFKTLPNLKTHISNIHSPANRKIKCEECGDVLKMNSYKRHKTRHLLGEEQQCPHCSFKSKYLEQHIKRVHNKVKPYPCSVCSMEFHTNKSMLDHMASRHTGIPRYKCNFCEKTFMTYGNFDAHRKRAHPRQLADLKLKRKMDKAQDVDLKAIISVKAHSKHNQVVQDVDSVLRNIEELDKSKML